MEPIKEEYKQEEEESKSESTTQGSTSAPAEGAAEAQRSPVTEDLSKLTANEICRKYIGKCTADRSTWPDFVRMYWRSGEEPSEDVLQYFSQFVPEEIRELWMGLY
jgi:hypothetical protein